MPRITFSCFSTSFIQSDPTRNDSHDVTSLRDKPEGLAEAICTSKTQNQRTPSCDYKQIASFLNLLWPLPRITFRTFSTPSFQIDPTRNDGHDVTSLRGKTEGLAEAICTFKTQSQRTPSFNDPQIASFLSLPWPTPRTTFRTFSTSSFQTSPTRNDGYDVTSLLCQWLPQPETRRIIYRTTNYFNRQQLERGGYIYILANKNNTVLYVGVTSDLYGRIWQHQTGHFKNSFTSRYNVTKLVYFEEFGSVEDAIAREKQLKGGSRQKKVDLINRMNPEWNDLFESVRHL